MFELVVWLGSFILLLIVTFFAGKHHAEVTAVRRILKRHGSMDFGPFEENNGAELKRRIDQATRRLKLGATELNKLKRMP